MISRHYTDFSFMLKDYLELTEEEINKIIDFRNAIYLDENYINAEEALYVYNQPDVYDPVSTHCFVYNNNDESLAGYMRLIRPSETPLPIELEYPELQLVGKDYIEASKLCINKNNRGRLHRRTPNGILINQLMFYCLNNQISSVYCIIDEKFLSVMINSYNFCLEILGDKKHYMGDTCYPVKIDPSESFKTCKVTRESFDGLNKTVFT